MPSEIDSGASKRGCNAFTLFLLFLVFVFLDIAMSGIALQYGGREIGVLYQVIPDFRSMAFVKGVFSFLTGMMLVINNQIGLLAVANIFMLGLGIYHGIMLWQTFQP